MFFDDVITHLPLPEFFVLPPPTPPLFLSCLPHPPLPSFFPSCLADHSRTLADAFPKILICDVIFVKLGLKGPMTSD